MNEVYGYEYEDESSALATKQYYSFEEGDQFRLYARYYDLDFNDDGLYYVGDTITVGSEGVNIKYGDLPEGTSTYYYYKITDIYKNIATTEWLNKKN